MSGFNEVARPFDGAAEPVRAKLFAHGGSQAVRLPKAFRFEGSEVTVRREGEAVILEPVERRRKTAEDVAALWARIDAIRCDHVLEYPPEPDAQVRDFK